MLLFTISTAKFHLALLPFSIPKSSPHVFSRHNFHSISRLKPPNYNIKDLHWSVNHTSSSSTYTARILLRIVFQQKVTNQRQFSTLKIIPIIVTVSQQYKKINFDVTITFCYFCNTSHITSFVLREFIKNKLIPYLESQLKYYSGISAHNTILPTQKYWMEWKTLQKWSH